MKQLFSKRASLIVFLLSGALLVYNIIRIVHIPITHDECGVISNLPSYSDYFHLKYVTVNTHILNSILRKFFIGLFNDTSPFTLRLGNLLAQLVYMFFSYKLVRRLIENGLWIVIGFLILNLSHFMFDFWGVSRGYGLALGFMMCSIYYFVAYAQNKKALFLWAYLLSGVLSVYSNFSLLNYFLGSLCVLISPYILYKENKIASFFRRELAPVTVALVLLYILIAEPIKKLKAANEFVYGGDNGIIQDTVRSLVNECYHWDDTRSTIITAAIVILVVAISIYWAVLYIRRRSDSEVKNGITLLLLLLMPLLAMVLQHQLLGIKYAWDRATLSLLVLYKIQLVYWLYHLSHKFKKTSMVLMALFFSFTLYNFVRLANVNWVRYWWFDSRNVVVLERIMNESKDKKDKIKLRPDWHFAPSLIYYWDTKYKDRLEEVKYTKDEPGPDTTYDFYYIFKEQVQGLSKRYVVDTSFYKGDLVLLKKN